jgi:hypothetical protein
MQPDFRRTAGNIVDGQHIEARRTIVQMAARQKELRGTDQNALFGMTDAQLRQARDISTHSARSDFHESHRFPVVSHQIQLALGALRHIIFCNENVALPAQIPVTISFSEQASATGLFLAPEFLTPLRFFILFLWRSVSRESRRPRRALQCTTVNIKRENMGMTCLGRARTVPAVYKEKSRGARIFYGRSRDDGYLTIREPSLCLAFHFLNTLLKNCKSGIGLFAVDQKWRRKA